MPNKSHNQAPLVISMGDPAGVGPEVTHRALLETQVFNRREIMIVGDVMVFARCIGDNTELQNYHIVPYEDFLASPQDMIDEFTYESGSERKPFFLDLGRGDDGIEIGEPSPEAAELAYISLIGALDVIDNGVADTLVTAPLSKFWVNQAGVSFDGHTEVLGKHFKSSPVMSFVGGGLKVALVTTHLSIADVPGKIKRKRVESIVRAFDASLKEDFALREPRIALCGLNPHAGENGRFGQEDRKVLEPLVEALKADGINIDGPFGSDTLFLRAAYGMYDGVVAHYHDQGLIPVKLLSAGHAVNVTANLPIVRTSPDHGTAYDIAGTGKAEHQSMLHAIDLADAIARRRDGKRVAAIEIERPMNMASLKPLSRARSGRHKPVKP